MAYDKALIAGKLRRWEKYLEEYRLPDWDDIPNFGLYMEQVIVLVRQYVDYLPPELKEEQVVTPAAINNYVRNKIMPEPIKKRYYRVHIAYLIMICTLKQTLSISMLQVLIPLGIDEDSVRDMYISYAERYRLATKYFTDQVRSVAGPILDHKDVTALSATKTEELISTTAIVGGFAKLLAEKLLLLEGCDLENGGSIEIETRKK